MIIATILVFTIIQFVVVGALCVSNIKLWIELKSIQKSTHQIVMPSVMAENTFSSQTEDGKKTIDEAFSEFRGIN